MAGIVHLEALVYLVLGILEEMRLVKLRLPIAVLAGAVAVDLAWDAVAVLGGIWKKLFLTRLPHMLMLSGLLAQQEQRGLQGQLVGLAVLASSSLKNITITEAN
jgi:hypothetical protein